MAAFDWYQATIPAPVNDVLAALSDLAPGLVLSHRKGMHGYGQTTILGNEQDGTVASVWHGGSHEYPHAVLTSDWAQQGAECIRAAFPKHSVTRLDVREDFEDEGAFDRIQPHLLATAAAHRVKVGTAGDHLLTMKGRTTYLGSTSSAVRMRLYDKREEVLSKLPPCGDERTRGFQALKERLGLDAMPDHWTRLEAQVRPATREGRAHFASIEPVDALGSSTWMREVWKAVAGLELRPVQVGRGYRQQDDERAYRYLLAQYGGLLRRIQADLGSWECVGLQIGDDLAAR
jgi:hypothetical protein